MTGETLYNQAVKGKTLRGNVTGLFDAITDEEVMIAQCVTVREEDLAYGLIMTNWIWEWEIFNKQYWCECYAELLTKRPKKQEQFDAMLDKYCHMKDQQEIVITSNMWGTA
jgi:hypothetical protein